MRNKKEITVILAIIIPYYKIGHFDELLDALKNQTNPNFNVYVGNDCSPEDPQKIIEKYTDKLNIFYKKFDQNLGRLSLAKQWGRCVEMIEDEEWVWVLPDDDLPSNNCVEEFYKALEYAQKIGVKVFRFPLKIIDGESRIISEEIHEEPEVEDNYDFYLRQVKGETSSSLGDNIFHRESLQNSGGFVEFPKAWGSDHATVLNVSKGGKLCCLKNASLSFRMSGENISSHTTDSVEKMKSRVMFAKWLKNNENIFAKQPDKEFYQYFYWKGEYYVLHEWPFSLRLLYQLYKLQKVCLEKTRLLSIFSITSKKYLSF